MNGRRDSKDDSLQWGCPLRQLKTLGAKKALRRRHHAEYIEVEGPLRQTRRADKETVENTDLDRKIKV